MRSSFNRHLLDSGFPFGERGTLYIVGLLNGAILTGGYDPASMNHHLMDLHLRKVSIEGYGG